MMYANLLVVLTTIFAVAIIGVDSAGKPTPKPKKPKEFDGKEDARILRKAMKGWGTNEKDVFSVAGTRTTYSQRRKIVEAYAREFHRDLVDDLESELSGDTELLITSMFMTPEQVYATEIHYAVAGLGTDETTLNDVFCCMTEANMEDVRTAFKSLFSKDMDKEVRADVSGDYETALDALMGNKRRQGVDPTYVKKSADHLRKAGTDRWFGTDESEFINVFSKSSYEELKQIAQQYDKSGGPSLVDDITSETSGDLRNLLLQILSYAMDPVKYFTRRLNTALHGASFLRNVRPITRILVMRAGKDLAKIKDMYKIIYWSTLERDVEGHTGKAYKEAALAIINGNH